MRPVFRLPPKGPLTAYKTYALRLPEATHYRRARCEEVQSLCANSVLDEVDPCLEYHCGPHAHGWQTVTDVSTELGARQARYIREQSGRRGSIIEAGTLVTFVFPPGQQCFAEHKVSLEREPFYILRDGDARGNPTGRVRRHASAADWVSDFGEHQQRIVDAIERG